MYSIFAFSSIIWIGYLRISLFISPLKAHGFSPFYRWILRYRWHRLLDGLRHIISDFRCSHRLGCGCWSPWIWCRWIRIRIGASKLFMLYLRPELKLLQCCAALRPGHQSAWAELLLLKHLGWSCAPGDGGLCIILTRDNLILECTHLLSRGLSLLGLDLFLSEWVLREQIWPDIQWIWNIIGPVPLKIHILKFLLRWDICWWKLRIEHLAILLESLPVCRKLVGGTPKLFSCHRIGLVLFSYVKHVLLR